MKPAKRGPKVIGSPVLVRLTDRQKAKAQAIGQGNVARGVRTAIDRARHPVGPGERQDFPPLDTD